MRDAAPDRCPYGGFLRTSAKATGFFRVEQIDGRWWFVCPDGHLFFSTGVNGVGTAAGTRRAGPRGSLRGAAAGGSHRAAARAQEAGRRPRRVVLHLEPRAPLRRRTGARSGRSSPRGGSRRGASTRSTTGGREAWRKARSRACPTRRCCAAGRRPIRSWACPTSTRRTSRSAWSRRPRASSMPAGTIRGCWATSSATSRRGRAAKASSSMRSSPARRARCSGG